MKKIIILFAVLSGISACGVKGDPLPPEKIPTKKVKEKTTPISEAISEKIDEDELKKVQ